MKTLTLMAILTLSIHAQDLVSADGVVWHFIAHGRDKDGAKFNVFARRVKGEGFPALEVKTGDLGTFQAEHDCKRGMYRIRGGEWAKPQAKSVGGLLLKFACKRK